MTIILGARDYEKTSTGKYPKYTLDQLNLWVDPECPSYTGISTVMNLVSFDLFGKYKEGFTEEEVAIFAPSMIKIKGLY